MKIIQLQAKLARAALSMQEILAVAHDPLLSSLRKHHLAANHEVRRLAIETIVHALGDHPDLAAGLCHAVLRPKRRTSSLALDLGKSWVGRAIDDAREAIRAARCTGDRRAVERFAHRDEEFVALGVAIGGMPAAASLASRLAALAGEEPEAIRSDDFLHDASTDTWRQRRADGTWMGPFSLGALKQKVGHEGKGEAFLRSITSFDAVKPFYGDWRQLVVVRGETFFNSFSGWPLESQPGRWPNIRRVLINLVAGDLATYEYLLDWLAVPLQSLRLRGRPRKTRTAIVIHGAQGAGKGTLESILRAIYGEDRFLVLGQDALDGRFVGDLESSLFVVANEVMSSTNRSAQTENKLKSWVTDPKIPVEKKYQHPRVVENMFNVLFTSNDDRPVIVPSGDRRYTVIRTWPVQLPAWLTDAVYADLQGDKREVRAFLHHLLHRRVRNDVGVPMATDARAEVQAATASSEVKFAKALEVEGWRALSRPWAEAQRPRFQGDIDHNRVVLCHEGFPEKVAAARLFDVYRDWCCREGLRQCGQTKLGKSVKQHIDGASSKWEKFHGEGMQVWSGLPMDPSTEVLVDAPVPPEPSRQEPDNL